MKWERMTDRQQRPAGGGPRRDPTRKDRILAATLDVILDNGVGAVTHRRIAERAGVPLGSVTYYFATLDDVLEQAFERFVSEQRDAFARVFTGVATREELLDVLVGLVLSSRSRSRSAVLGFELHLAALRRESVRVLTRRWTEESRQVLASFTDGDTAARLDDLLEGLILHQLIADGPANTGAIRTAIDRVLGPATS